MISMRPCFRIWLLISAGLVPALAQEPAAAPAPAPALTEQQVSAIMKQLTELEQQIQKMRGDTLTQVLQKLRTAASSDQAALGLYLDCEKLVNIERKEVNRQDAKRQEERMERNADKGNAKDIKEEGDFATAVRLQIEYLILTLEAHESDDVSKMIPKLQAYVQEVISKADKLKGRAGNYLNADLGGRNPFVSAFQLDRYLSAEGWTTRPLDFRGMWEQTILPYYQEKKKDELASQWDNRINAEAAYRKAAMPEPEFLLWSQNELPAVRWERAADLYAHGSNPVNGMAEMLKLIKEFPGHPDAKTWLAELRGLVEKAAAGSGAAASAPSGAGTQ